MEQKYDIKVGVNIADHVTFPKNIIDYRNAAVNIWSSLTFSLNAILLIDKDLLSPNLVVSIELLNILSLILTMLQFEDKCWYLVNHNVDYESLKDLLDILKFF